MDIKTPFIKRTALNFGQEADVKALSQAYDVHVKQYGNTDSILYASSRGAAAGINFLATTYHQKKHKYIKAAVLESCFDSMETLLDYIYEKLVPFKSTATRNMFKKLFCAIYPEYNPDGLAPISSASAAPHDIPILLITSKKDILVPVESTQKLYYALKESRHPDIYILELNNSSHPRYMMANEDDKRTYEAVVHAFYQKYGLSHNPELAAYGAPILADCQP